MIVSTTTKKLFSYDELTEQSQNNAIHDLIEFYLACINYEDMSAKMQKACDEADQMRTPWFTSSYIWDYCKEELIETIQINEYLFDDSGSLASIDEYPSADYTD